MGNQRTHEWIDQRSLALHKETARLIREEPDRLNIAKANLMRWLGNEEQNASSALEEWRQILLHSSLDEILSIIESDTEQARRLRQSSPFCGILDQEKRLEIFARFEVLLNPELTQEQALSKLRGIPSTKLF